MEIFLIIAVVVLSFIVYKKYTEKITAFNPKRVKTEEEQQKLQNKTANFLENMAEKIKKLK